MYKKRIIYIVFIICIILFLLLCMTNRPNLRKFTILEKYSNDLICLPATYPGSSDKTLKEFIQTSDRIIWSYWDNEQIPWVVKLALKTWKQNQPQDCICLLTPKTLFSFIDKSDLPPNYQNLFTQRQADVIRIVLLEKYGGLWMDATFLLGRNIDHLWFPKNYDIGCYEADFFTTNPKVPVLENWFISAPKNSPLIKAWKKEFYFGLTFKTSDDYINYLKTQQFDFQKVNIPSYLMMHCSLMRVLSSPHSYTIKHFPASEKNDGPFSYLINNNWSSTNSVRYLTKPMSSNTFIPRTIKLRGGERKALESWSCISKNSIIGKLLLKELKNN